MENTYCAFSDVQITCYPCGKKIGCHVPSEAAGHWAGRLLLRLNCNPPPRCLTLAPGSAVPGHRSARVTGSLLEPMGLCRWKGQVCRNDLRLDFFSFFFFFFFWILNPLCHSRNSKIGFFESWSWRRARRPSGAEQRSDYESPAFHQLSCCNKSTTA